MTGQLYCFNTTAAGAFVDLNGGQQLFIMATTPNFRWYPAPLNPAMPFAAVIAQNQLGYGENTFQFGWQGDAVPAGGTITISDKTSLDTDFQLYLTPMGGGRGVYCLLQNGRYLSGDFSALAQIAGGT